MIRSLPHRLLYQALLATLLVGAPCLAVAQNSVLAVDSASRARPAVTGGLGLTEAVLPVGGSPALTVFIDLAGPAAGRSRVVAGIAYAREVGTSGSCCGPNPGYTYQEEALSLSLGRELRLGSPGAGELWIDARYQPTLAHTIRHGSQEDFVPSPTRWQFSGTIGSMGLTARWPLRGQLRASVGARLHVDVGAVALGGRPRTGLGFILGVARQRSSPPEPSAGEQAAAADAPRR
jgi:hypothetical protein